MIRLILNDEHLGGALGEAMRVCRHRLFIATANVKDVHVPVEPARPSSQTPPRGHFSGRASGTRLRARRGSRSIIDVFHDLSSRGIEVHMLHGGVPSGPFLGELKKGIPATLTMRRCPRVHAKVVCADGRWMYLGSANLTGAGLGAKSRRRRNFEAGIWTDDLAIIDPILDMLESIWSGSECLPCGRKDYCPVPLEQPAL